MAIRTFGWTLALLIFGTGFHATAADPTSSDFSVMTYNVNYGLAGDPSTLRAIRDGGADVAFLQETNELWERELRAQLSSIYPHMAFRHCCGAGGLAVLSKWPIRDTRYLEPVSWFPAWVVEVRRPAGRFQVLNVHLRPPLDDSGSPVSGYFSTPEIRHAEITRFFGALSRDVPTLVVGDFNENDGRATAYLESRRMENALDAFAPDATTWRWQTSLGALRGRYDHIFFGERLVATHARVLRSGRSDHLPVVATLRSRN